MRIWRVKTCQTGSSCPRVNPAKLVQSSLVALVYCVVCSCCIQTEVVLLSQSLLDGQKASSMSQSQCVIDLTLEMSETDASNSDDCEAEDDCVFISEDQVPRPR